VPPELLPPELLPPELLPPELLPPELLPPELLPPELLPPELLPPDALLAPLPDEPLPPSSLVPDVPHAATPATKTEIRATKAKRRIMQLSLPGRREQVACPQFSPKNGASSGAARARRWHTKAQNRTLDE
jgi:hypothetical protein